MTSWLLYRGMLLCMLCVLYLSSSHSSCDHHTCCQFSHCQQQQIYSLQQLSSCLLSRESCDQFCHIESASLPLFCDQCCHIESASLPLFFDQCCHIESASSPLLGRGSVGCV